MKAQPLDREAKRKQSGGFCDTDVITVMKRWHADPPGKSGVSWRARARAHTLT